MQASITKPVPKPRKYGIQFGLMAELPAVTTTDRP